MIDVPVSEISAFFFREKDPCRAHLPRSQIVLHADPGGRSLKQFAAEIERCLEGLSDGHWEFEDTRFVVRFDKPAMAPWDIEFRVGPCL